MEGHYKYPRETTCVICQIPLFMNLRQARELATGLRKGIACKAHYPQWIVMQKRRAYAMTETGERLVPVEAPCVICNQPVQMTRGQQGRYRTGRSVVHLGECLSKLRSLTNKTHANARRREPKPLACTQCRSKYMPTQTEWFAHLNTQRAYVCLECAKQKEISRSAAQSAELRTLYFSLLAKGALPQFYVHRRVW